MVTCTGVIFGLCYARSLPFTLKEVKKKNRDKHVYTLQMFRNKTLQGHCYVAVLLLDSCHQFLWCQQEASNLAFAALSPYGLWGPTVSSWSSRRLDSLLNLLDSDIKHQHEFSSLDPSAFLMSLSLIGF